jgi:hypothetical protein
MLWQRDDSTTRLHRWLETLTISMAAPLLGLVAHPADPYLVAAAFPWLALVPLLVGASHGLAPGVVSAVLLAAGATAHGLRFHALQPELASWAAGCLITGAIAGQFRDAARRRRWLLDERAHGLSLQLERAQRARQMLALSHERLEQRTAAVASSLDASLQDAEQRMAQHSTGAELGQTLLEVLAMQGIVQAATLYRVLDAARSRATPIAQLGAARVGAEPHALVRRVLETGGFAGSADAETFASGAARDWSVVAAVPVSSASGRLVGVVAVHQMPFMALAPDQLRNTLLLASYLADLMEASLKRLEPQPSAAARKRAKPPLMLPAPPPLGASAALARNTATRGQLPAFEVAAHGGRLALIGASLKAPKSRPGPNSG